LALVLLGSACGDYNLAPPPSPPPPPTQLVLQAHVVHPMSDAVIVSVMVTANSAEIEQAKLALDQAHDARVRDFAQMMQTDHTAALDRMNNLARHLGLDSATPSDLRTRLGTEAAGQLLRLALSDGAAFDLTYMEIQVLVHGEVLSMLDNTLMPAARDPALRAELEMTRSLVARHLTMAKELLGHL
jgi:putative membrane protein